jgi:hypothetical protein
VPLPYLETLQTLFTRILHAILDRARVPHFIWYQFAIQGVYRL